MNDAPSKLELTCVCGQVGLSVDADFHPWAQIVGYGNFHALAWFATEGDALVREAPIDILEAPPVIGQRCWLRLAMPFGSQVGDTFWSLYTSPNAYWNGIDDTKESFQSPRFVACRLLDWSGDPKDRVIGSVEVLDVKSIASLSVMPLFSCAADTGLLEDFLSGFMSVKHFGDLSHIDWTFEGDGGGWLIVRTIPRLEILVLGEWGSHSDYFWAGRAAPSAEQTAGLRKLLAK